VFEVLPQPDIALAESEAAMHFSKARSLSRETPSSENMQDQPGPIFIETGVNLVRANAFGNDGTLLRIEVVRE
jgi:hypothetical protein